MDHMLKLVGQHLLVGRTIKGHEGEVHEEHLALIAETVDLTRQRILRGVVAKHTATPISRIQNGDTRIAINARLQLGAEDCPRARVDLLLEDPGHFFESGLVVGQTILHID